MNLAELITQIRHDREWTYRQLNERGRQIAKQYGWPVRGISWYYLANEPLRGFPEPRTVRLLAAALDVPLKTVTDAMLESVGLVEVAEGGQSECSGDQSGESLVVISTEGLTDEEIAHIRETARSVVESLESAYLGSRGHGESPPVSPGE